MDSEEQQLLKESENNFQTKDSLLKVRDFLVDLVPSLSTPSELFLFAMGKILYYISDYETLDALLEQFEGDGIKLWKIRVSLERGFNEDALKESSIIKEKEKISVLFKLQAIRSIAKGYLNLGNYEQCKIYLNELFERGLKTQKLPKEEKKVINDILLDGHKDSFFVNRYVEEKIKLENKINVAIHIARDLKERNNIATFYYLMALLERDGGKLEDSYLQTHYAIEIFNQTGNKNLLAAAKGNLGTIDVIKGDLKNAEKIFNEILEIFSGLEDNRYIALTVKSLGNIAIEKGDFEEAIEKYKEALNMIERMNLKEPYQYCVLAELYLQTNKDNDYEIIINSLDEEIRANPSPTIESYILFLKGIKSIKSLNYGQAEQSLKNALLIADRLGRGELSAKILMNLILLSIGRYDVEKNLEFLQTALLNLDQLLPYFIENKLLREQIALYLLQGKIQAIREDYIKSFNSLQKAKDLLLDQKNKQLLQIVVKRIEDVSSLIPKKVKKKIDWIEEPFRKDMSDLSEFGLKHMQKSHVEIDISPLALIILHRSGIPLRSYVILKRTVKDQLLFGGFIVAVKDMLSELFEEQKSQMLVITYGNHKIVIEAHPKGFSSVAVSAYDSFSLRRKIHQLTDKLAELNIPKQFYGELPEGLGETIDEEVNNLFGQTLVFSDTLKIDI
jgi:tetratricopeptide (TPR) repeat protein